MGAAGGTIFSILMKHKISPQQGHTRATDDLSNALSRLKLSRPGLTAKELHAVIVSMPQFAGQSLSSVKGACAQLHAAEAEAETSAQTAGSPQVSWQQARWQQASKQNVSLQKVSWQQDEDLLSVVFALLPPTSLLCCAATSKCWHWCALQDTLWLSHRQQQRLENVPWAPLPPTQGSGAARNLATEWRRGLQAEDRGLLGTPVWTRGRGQVADWPALVADERMVRGMVSVHVRLVGSPEVTWCHATHPILWEVGLSDWEANQGAPHSWHDPRSTNMCYESEGRAKARNAAVQELLAAIEAHGRCSLGLCKLYSLHKLNSVLALQSSFVDDSV